MKEMTREDRKRAFITMANHIHESNEDRLGFFEMVILMILPMQSIHKLVDRQRDQFMDVIKIREKIIKGFERIYFAEQYMLQVPDDPLDKNKEIEELFENMEFIDDLLIAFKKNSTRSNSDA